MEKVLLVLALAITGMITGCASGPTEEDTSKKKAQLYYNQGTKELYLKEYTSALGKLLRAHKLDPENTDIQSNLAMAYHFKGDNNRAIHHLRAAIELDEENIDAKLNLATIYMKSNKLSEAKDMYHDILKSLTYSGQFRTHYNLSIIATKQGRADLALEHLRKSVEIKEDYCPANFQMAKIYKQRRDFKRAYQYFKQAGLGVCYQRAEPFLGQIDVLIEQKKYGEASVKAEKLMERFALSKYESAIKNRLMKIKRLKQREASQIEDLAVREDGADFSSPDF